MEEKRKTKQKPSRKNNAVEVAPGLLLLRRDHPSTLTPEQVDALIGRFHRTTSR